MKQGYTYFIGTSWSGAIPDHFKALAKELASRGHRVILLVDGQRKDVVDEASNPGVLTWPSRRPTRLRDALFLAGLVRRYRPQCVIGNFGSVNVMMMVGWLMRIPVRVAYVHTLTGQIAIDWRRSKLLLLYLNLRKRVVYRLCSFVIATSSATREDAKAAHRVPSSKLHVLHTSLADPVCPGGLPGRERRLLLVGRLDLSKGQDVAIRAMAIIRREYDDVSLELLGKGSMEREYRELVKELGLDNCCLFSGAVPHEAVLDRMASSYAVLVPSRADNLPNVCIESLAVGTPVVASRVGGIVDIVRDGLDGYLVPPDDPKALAEKLAVLLSNRELRDQIGRNARQRFLDTFEQSKVVQEQANWFERIVAEAVQRG